LKRIRGRGQEAGFDDDEREYLRGGERQEGMGFLLEVATLS
jgi:hypothetical protein